MMNIPFFVSNWVAFSNSIPENPLYFSSSLENSAVSIYGAPHLPAWFHISTSITTKAKRMKITPKFNCLGLNFMRSPPLIYKTRGRFFCLAASTTVQPCPLPNLSAVPSVGSSTALLPLIKICTITFLALKVQFGQTSGTLILSQVHQTDKTSPIELPNMFEAECCSEGLPL